MMKKGIFRLSKFLSLVLRHKPELLDLDLDDQGFVNISLDEFLNRLRSIDGFSWVTIEHLKIVIRDDRKLRYEIVDNKIRARYGHSIPVKLLDESEKNLVAIPALLYHGTSPEIAEKILKEGLKSLNRVNVHLSCDLNTAFTVGKRHCPEPVILVIDARKLIKSGQTVKKAGNKVFITDDIPSILIRLHKSST
ncbi:MAG: RNA 2'-phosphotransferase [Candidatus Hodarchaeales archaeon]